VTFVVSVTVSGMITEQVSSHVSAHSSSILNYSRPTLTCTVIWLPLPAALPTTFDCAITLLYLIFNNKLCQNWFMGLGWVGFKIEIFPLTSALAYNSVYCTMMHAREGDITS